MALVLALATNPSGFCNPCCWARSRMLHLVFLTYYKTRCGIAALIPQ